MVNCPRRLWERVQDRRSDDGTLYCLRYTACKLTLSTQAKFYDLVLESCF